MSKYVYVYSTVHHYVMFPSLTFTDDIHAFYQPQCLNSAPLRCIYTL